MASVWDKDTQFGSSSTLSNDDDRWEQEYLELRAVGCRRVDGFAEPLRSPRAWAAAEQRAHDRLSETAARLPTDERRLGPMLGASPPNLAGTRNVNPLWTATERSLASTKSSVRSPAAESQALRAPERPPLSASLRARSPRTQQQDALRAARRSAEV